MSERRQRAISGLKWTTVSQAGRLVAQLFSLFVLARLLPSTDFGLLAMASTITGFATLFLNLGTGTALIQKRELTESLLDSVFILNITFGVGLALLLVLFAPVIAWGFKEPRLTDVLYVLAIMFPIANAGVAHQSLMERESRFHELARLELISVTGGTVVAIGGAWAGWGVFSLALQMVMTALLISVQLWFRSGWRPTFRWNVDEIRGLWGFSSNLVGFNVFNYFARNADSLLIGRFLGASDLGYYAMAYKIMVWPLQNISSVVGRAMLPVFSRMQEDDAAFGRIYLRMTQSIALISFPLMTGLFVLRNEFVEVTLGIKWQPAVELLAWFAPIGLLQSIGTTVGMLYLAKGRTDVMFKWGVGAGSLIVIAFILGLQGGVTGVAAAYCYINLIIFLPSLYIPLKFIGMPLKAVLKGLAPTALASLLMGFVLYVLSNSLRTYVSSSVLLLVMILTGVLVYAGISLALQRDTIINLMRDILNRRKSL